MTIIQLLSISMLVGVIYANISLGAGITFRILGVPDLTLEGGGMLAGASTVLVLNAGGGALVGIAAAVAAGVAAGGSDVSHSQVGSGEFAFWSRRGFDVVFINVSCYFRQGERSIR